MTFLKIKSSYTNAHTGKLVEHDFYQYINISDISKFWEDNYHFVIKLKSTPNHQDWIKTKYPISEMVENIRVAE